MLTKQEVKHFVTLAKQIDIQTIKAWIEELHGKIDQFEYWTDEGEDAYYEYPVLTWLASETHCCSLFYSDPPNWFVYRILMLDKAPKTDNVSGL